MHGPWGSDAVGESELGPHAPRVWRRAMQQRGIRVVTIRRDLGRRHFEPPADLRLVYVAPGRPGTAPVVQRTDLVDLHDVVAATEWLVDGGPPTDHWRDDPDRYVMVCTNGKHDACCAVQGRPIVRALRDSRWHDQVWECSHIGGDRFAGNVVLMPDGLYFGRCTPEGVADLLAAHDDGRLDMTHLRGRCTLTLDEQAAEHHVRRQLGLDGLDAIVGIEPHDDDRIAVTVATGGATDTVLVDVARTAVTTPDPLTCKGRAEQTYPAFTPVTVSTSNS